MIHTPKQSIYFNAIMVAFSEKLYRIVLYSPSCELGPGGIEIQHAIPSTTSAPPKSELYISA